MKIATYNINGINGRIDTLLKWLKIADPDILCLQELKCEDKSFPISKINQAGYQAVWHGQKSWNGVAVLSKKEIRELRRDLPGEDPEFTHSRYLEVFTFDMVIGCIYLPFGNPYPGPKYEFKKRWFSRLIDHSKTLKATGLPVMMIGDYNVMPTELDTYKPEKYKNDALFRPEIRENFIALLDQGWTDAIRTLYPHQLIYTYWDYLRKAYDRNAGLRLDHFLLSEDLAEKLKGGNVDKEVRGWEGASDHAPVWIELVGKALKKNLKHKHPEKPRPVKVKQTARNKTFKPHRLLLSGTSEIQEKKVDGHLLKFTNLSKLYWPRDGVSKRDMFNYYDQIAPMMLPYLVDRPMSLNRFPGGIHGESFYQKNVKETAPQWAHTIPHTNEKGEEKCYLLGHDKATLLWMASLGCIEMNPWFSRASAPDHPDYCVIDLDPDKNTFDQVIHAAQITHSILEDIGVPNFAKTSGSTGIHIYIPLGAKYTYEQSQLFANLIVRQVNREIPRFTTLERSISKRGGKMYLDFLQNRPGATIAGVYSLRPKPGATVSMPLDWAEVKPGLKMRDFTIFNAMDRLKETGDLFSGVLGEGIVMEKVIRDAQGAFS